MYDFDSRRLTTADCYGRRFVKSGLYAYAVHTVADDDDTSAVPAYPFLVEVRADASAAARQHAVVIRDDDDRFAVDQPAITVHTGDFVVWHAAEASRPFVIASRSGCFGNDPLGSHCRYSHAFQRAGVHEWADANGSGLGGVVRVTEPRIGCEEDRRQRQRRLRSSVLVMIRGTHVEPPQVTIETGQRVYFAVLASPGVTVTDVRLLERAERGERRATSA